MWARPAQITGPSPAYKKVARSRPNKFWGGLDPAHKFGLGKIRPDQHSRLMILPLHAEYLLHAMATRLGAGTGQK